MLIDRYYHVTERDDAQTILREGFQGGWGDLGFGVYTYASRDDAEKYAVKGGWDGELKDPVILVIEDASLCRVIPDHDWDETLYENMYWKEMDEDDETLWHPERLYLLASETLAPPTPSSLLDSAKVGGSLPVARVGPLDMPLHELPPFIQPDETPALRLQRWAIDQVRAQLTATPATSEQEQARLRIHLRGLHTLPIARPRR